MGKKEPLPQPLPDTPAQRLWDRVSDGERMVRQDLDFRARQFDIYKVPPPHSPPDVRLSAPINVGEPGHLFTAKVAMQWAFEQLNNHGFSVSVKSDGNLEVYKVNPVEEQIAEATGGKNGVSKKKEKK